MVHTVSKLGQMIGCSTELDVEYTELVNWVSCVVQNWCDVVLSIGQMKSMSEVILTQSY